MRFSNSASCRALHGSKLSKCGWTNLIFIIVLDNESYHCTGFAVTDALTSGS